MVKGHPFGGAGGVLRSRHFFVVAVEVLDGEMHVEVLDHVEGAWVKRKLTEKSVEPVFLMEKLMCH